MAPNELLVIWTAIQVFALVAMVISFLILFTIMARKIFHRATGKANNADQPRTSNYAYAFVLSTMLFLAIGWYFRNH